MADERDLELLDDYLTNRMSEQDRSAFEQKLQADPDLQHEYALQKRLIKGIKEARVAELKSMLNKVPVPAKGPGNALATKIILGTAVTFIAIATYWYISREDVNVADPGVPSDEQVTEEQPITQEQEQVTDQESQESAEEQEAVEPDKNQTSAGTEQSKPSLSKKPDPLEAPEKKEDKEAPANEPVLDVFDPGAEDSPGAIIDKENQPVYRSGKSTLVVETDRENARYKLHYQFREDKLYLYGPFEQGLYEIMEFFAGEKRSVFLYYKDRYYRLKESGDQVRSLEPITDPALVKKLKEYRSSK